MKQEGNISKVIHIGDGKPPSIGKCCMCTRQILNDPEEFWCCETRLIGNKYFCGGCLLELEPIIEEVRNAFNKEKAIARETGHYYSIDMATGRMVTPPRPDGDTR